MKKIYLLFFLILNSLFIFAQTDTFYFNQNNLPVDKSLAEKVRITYLMEDHRYLIKNFSHLMQLESILYSNTKEGIVYEGPCYHFNTQSDTIVKGQYMKGYKINEWLFYFNDGKKIKEKQIYPSMNLGYYTIKYDSAFQQKTEEGEIDSYGKMNGKWIKYFENKEQIKQIQFYEHGKKEGKQIEYYDNLQVKREEDFANGKLIKGKMWDSSGNKIKYYPAFVYPKYPEYLNNYLIKYSACAKAILDTQEIKIRLKISKEGKVILAEILSKIENQCIENIREALLSMKRWKPALWENKAIHFTYETTIKRKM